jgi:hypothetical protein
MRCLPLAALLVLAPALVSAQEAISPPGMEAHPLAAPRFEMPEDAEEVSIPFRLINQHIVLPAIVNGQGPLQIVLDTGMPAEGLALNDGEKVASLHLTYLDNVRVMIGGVGGNGQAKPARMAEGLTIQIGSLKLLDARATLLPPIPGFAAYSDGVIGAALFRHFAVTVDNDRGVVVLRKPGAYEPPAGAAVIPLTEDHPAPRIEARVRLGDGASIPVQLAVDLGASHAVSLNETGSNGIAVPAHTLATVIGRGLSGPLTGRVGRIRSLELGGLVLSDVVATFPDAKYRTQPGMNLGDGNLGNGALSRFNVTLDYAGRRMVLQPSRRAGDPFEWDMSGMLAEPTGEGAVRVREVLDGSPAAEAGVRKEDRVVKIAGQPVDEKSYFDLREKLRKDGETVKVELLRGSKPVEVSLRLRRLI